MSGMQEGNTKSEFLTRPISQLDLGGANLSKPPIMIGSGNVRNHNPLSKGQPVVTKVVQTIPMVQQSPNILVVGQARTAQPNANLVVPGSGHISAVGGGVGGFMMGNSVISERSTSVSSAMIGNLQSQQIQAQQLLQQHHSTQQLLQQSQQQNIMNSFASLPGGAVNLAANNQPSLSMISGHSMIGMVDSAHHQLHLPGTANLQNRFIRNRAPVIENKLTLQSIQANITRPPRPNIVSLSRPALQTQQYQIATSSTSPSSLHIMAVPAAAMPTVPSSGMGVSGGNTYLVTNAGSRLILSGTARTSVPQIQKTSVTAGPNRSQWPAQLIPSSHAVTVNPLKANVPPSSLGDPQSRCLSMAVQPLVRPVLGVPQQQQQQAFQATRGVLSPSLPSPINLSASAISKSVAGQNQALNLSQPIPRQPTVILASASVSKTTTSSVNQQPPQVNKIIPQSPLNLTKPRKLKLQTANVASTYSTFSIASPSLISPSGFRPGPFTVLPLSNVVSVQSTAITTSVPVAKVTPQLQVVHSGSQPQLQQQQQQIQLHSIQAAPTQLHIQQQQAQLLTSSIAQQQLRAVVSTVQSTNLMPGAMLIGGGYNIISPGSHPVSTVLHADKSLLQQFSFQDGSRFLTSQDGSRFLTSQGTHLISQNQLALSLSGLPAVQTISIPASTTLKPPNSSNITIVTSSLPMVTTQAVTSRVQPVILSIDSNSQALHQNFAFVAASSVVAAASSDCATDLSQKEASLQQQQQQQQQFQQQQQQQHQAHFTHLAPPSSVVVSMQHKSHHLHHQLIPPLSSTSSISVEGNSSAYNGAIKQQTQSPRPPILRKRPHDSSANTSKKNLFSTSLSSSTPSISIGSTTSMTTAASSMFGSGGHLAYFQPQNISGQLHQQANQQFFLNQQLSSVIAPLGSVMTLVPPGDNNVQFVVTTSPKAFDTVKDNSQSSTDTASSNENTPKPGQDLATDKNKIGPSSGKANVLSGSNNASKVAPENCSQTSEEDSRKSNSRKKPRKQQLVAQTTQSHFHSDMSSQKDAAMATDGMSSNGEDDDNQDEDVDDVTMNVEPHIGHSNEDVMSVISKDLNVEGEYIDKNGVRWTREKQRFTGLIAQQYQCSWKPRNNHFNSYSDFKLKEDRKPTINELSNQKCIIQRASGYKVYLVSAHLVEMKEEEDEAMNEMELTKDTLTTELQGLNLTDEFQSVNELIMANTQRSKKCIEQIDELRNSLLKLMTGKTRASEIISKHQSKRAVKKKDRM